MRRKELNQKKKTVSKEDFSQLKSRNLVEDKTLARIEMTDEYTRTF